MKPTPRFLLLVSLLSSTFGETAPAKRDPFAAPTRFATKSIQASSAARPDKLLEEARRARAARQWRLTLVTLREFVSTYPDHVYADRAHFWIAECHYELAEYKLTAATADYLVSHHPHSVRLTEAKLLAALGRFSAGEAAAAIELKLLLEKAPESRFSRIAEQKLLVGSLSDTP